MRGTNEDELSVDYEALWYVKLRGEDDKRALEKWGGYGQDFEAAGCVYSHEEVVSSPHEWWGIVGIRNKRRTRRELIILDLDTYKADDPEAAVETVTVPEGTLISRSQRGGIHVWFSVTAEKGAFKESDFEVHEDLEFPIDVRGSAVSHHVVAPSNIPGVGGSYEVVNDEGIRNHLTVEDVCAEVQFAGEPAVEYNPVAFIGDGDASGYTPDGEDEWLLEEDVKAALSHTSANLGYAEWRDIGFAVADYYARTGGSREDAIETFVGWSKTAEDSFDDETERHAWNIVKSGFESVENDDKDRVTLGTLLSVAGANGWEWPDVKDRKAYRDARNFIDKFDPVEVREDDEDAKEPSDSDKRGLAKATAALSDEHYAELADELEDRVNVTTETFERHRELSAVRDDHGDIVNWNGKLSNIGGKPWLDTSPIFNFEFGVESILELPGEDEGRSSNVRVKPSEPNEPQFEIDVEPRVFNDARRFKDTVLSQMYSTVIESELPDLTVMDMIRQYIAAQDVPVRQGQYEMGLSDDRSEFVTPSGAITVDGWSDDPNHVHVERGSKSNATVRAFESNPEENSDIDTGDIARMLELAAQSRLPERITPIMSWFAAAPFRPLIFEQSGTFNPLGVFGRSGSGKTKTLAALSQMWGMSNEPLSVNASKFATLTGFTSSRGVPVWYDEYRPEKTPDWIMDRWHTYYKKAATGGVEPRGNTSMGTDDWHLRSPIVVSGESEIANDAERRRTLMVNVSKKPTQEGHPARDAFKALVGDVRVDDDGNVQFPDAEFNLQDFAVKYYAWVTSMSDDEFRSAWHNARETVAEFAAKHEDDIDLGDTELQALQTVVFGYHRLVTFAQTVGADLSKLPSVDDLDAALKLVADLDGDGRQPHEHQFLSLVSRASAAEYLEDGTDYRVVHEATSYEELRVNVTRSFDKVSKFVRDHDLNEDLLQSASDYKKRFRQLEDEDTFVTVTGQPTQGISRCIGVDMERAVDEIAGFDHESFVEIPDDAESSSEIVVDDDDDDSGGPTPLKDINASDDYVSVTVTVNDWGPTSEELSGAGGPIESGSVVDETGRRNVVAFDYDAQTKPDGIEHMEDGATVRIQDAPVGEYMRSPQIQLDAGTTITPIQQGVGYTEGEDPGEGQATMTDASEFVNASDETPQDAARADGGSNPGDGTRVDENPVQKERVRVVRDFINELDRGDGAPIEEVVQACDDARIDPSKARHELEKLKRSGDVYESAEGRVKAT